MWVSGSNEGIHIIRIKLLNMTTMDSGQDLEHLSTTDYHSSEFNSVLLVLEIFLKELLLVMIYVLKM